MAESLMMQAIESDNKIAVNFSDKFLPKYARHGELFVVDGILYIFADLDRGNMGKWFPLTNEKEFYTFTQTEPSEIWNVPIEFETNNVQVVVYDEQGFIFPSNFTVNQTEGNIQLVFDGAKAGLVHIIINKAFDWVGRRFIVGDRQFAVTEDETHPNIYYFEVNSEYVEVLKNGNTTFRSDVTVGGTLNVETITNVNKLIVEPTTWFYNNVEIEKDVLVKGSVVIEGNLSVQGTTTTVNSNNISISNSTFTLNDDVTGTPVVNASIDVNRGDEGILSIVKFDESIDSVTIPVKQPNGIFVHNVVADRVYVDAEILNEKNRAVGVENTLNTTIESEKIRLNEEIARAKNAENALQNDVNSKAPQNDTYTKFEVDTNISKATTPEKTLAALIQIHGVGSGLDSELFAGKDASQYNQVLGLNETITISGATVIESITLENGVVTGYTTREITLDDLGYKVEQDISTITNLQNIINMLTARLEALESKIG